MSRANPQRIGGERPAQRVIDRRAHVTRRKAGSAPWSLRAHQRERLRLGHEAVTAPAGDAPQDPQRIVAEGGRMDRAQDPRGEILAAAERVDPRPSSDVASHRVDA